MALSQSDNVDAFLSWLGTPAAGAQGQQQVAHFPSRGLGLGGAGGGDADKLKELRKSPLEDMARPLLLTGANGHPPGAAKTSL